MTMRSAKSWLIVALALAAVLAAPSRAAEPDFAAYEALCQKVQQNATAASEDDVKAVLQQAKTLGRPYTAHLAIKPYLEQNLKPSPALLLAAAENAFLAGDYRTAVGRYKGFLKDAQSNAESSAAAGRMYSIQLDFLGAADDAFQFMRQSGTKFRENPLAKKFDAWFLDEAKARKDFTAHAERLAIVLADKMPLEEERLYFWPHLDWLNDEISHVLPEHLPAAAAYKALVPLIRDTKRYTAKVGFYAANLAYFAGGFNTNKERGAAEFESVVNAARAYIDASPTAATLQDIYLVFVGGNGRFEDGIFSVQMPARQAVLSYAYGKLNDADKKTILNWNYGGRPAPRYIGTADQWLAMIPQAPALYTPALLAQFPMLESGNNPEIFKKQSAVLQGVASRAAAVSHSLSASAELSAVYKQLIEKESWYLQGNEFNDLMRNHIWGSFKSFPPPAGKPAVQDQVFNDTIMSMGQAAILQSPIAFFDIGAARDTVWIYWAANGADRAKFPAVLHSLDWIPYTEAERKQVFGQSYDNFKQWADAIRKQSKDNKDPKIAEAVAQITVLDKAFSEVMDAKIADPAKGPNPLCQKLAAALQAVRKQDKDAYLQNARELYGMVRDYEVKKTPFGSQVLRWICTTQPNIDSTEFQLQSIADQLTMLDPNGTHRSLSETTDGFITNRKGWQRHAWNWWDVPKRDMAIVKQLNDVLAKGILSMAEKDQFSPQLFSLFRATRRGQGWNDPAVNVAVLQKLIEKKLFSKAPYYPEWWVKTNTVSYQWLIQREFQGLGKTMPHETAFDDMLVEEINATKTLDGAYWQFGRDEKKKIVNAVAPILASFDKVPYGYDDGQRGYDRNELWDWHTRVIGADAAARDAWLSKIEGTYGQTRFDSYALGAPYFSVRASFEKPDARKEFFAKLGAYLDRIKTHPARVAPPFLDALNKITDAKTLTKEELDILLNVFPDNVPVRWIQGNHFETLAAVVHAGLVAQNRDQELFALVPHFWKIAKDVNNPAYQRTLAGFAKALSDANKHELTTVYISSGLDILGAEMAEDVQTSLRAIRSKSMLNVGSVNPFKRSDPRYAIGNAQAEFLSGKLQSAWEIYLAQRNQLANTYKELDPSFTLWLIEKNTEARNFEEAENLSRLMMQYFEATPGGFDAEIRARLFLNYANIAFERQEYPRARAHYERISEAKEYDGTRAKREAELRIADVDRHTKNYDRAIAQLEKLVKRRDDFLQTEALYQLAEIKFDQEDYVESSKFLEQVFYRNRNHAAGRILEGKLALQMKRYEKALDLAMGHASTQEMLVPGRPLKVTLEDKNLSVVGQSVQIEIRAWTDAGDEETFALMPVGDSKTTFEGRLPTALGKIEKNDHTLQVFGSDKVHYDFSDSFKKNHKITDARAGTLVVASNAELFVSSGKILSKEEMEERALEKLVRERLRADPNNTAELNKEALSKLRDDNQIKPGNPINIRVIDPDRNITNEKDKITVRVTATSGDKIPSFTLTETEPTSGVFEGSVPTASAQAIAFASDSEEGRDPNYAISSGDLPHWVALPDSVKPKTFSIDMNDNVALGKMNVESNVPGRKLKAFLIQSSLNGRDFQTIGQWPDEFKPWDGTPQIEVARWPGADNGPGNLTQFQQYLESGYLKSKAPKILLPPPTALSAKFDPDLNGKGGPLNFQHDGPGAYYVMHMYTAFSLPARQTRTFKADRTTGDKNRMKMIIAVDGQGGEKPDEVKRSLAKGVHRVDLYIFAWRHARPGFQILCDTEEPPFMNIVPAEMYDAAKHPEIKTAVTFEPAKITAEKEGGSFSVAFGAESRARSLRLVIADYETDAPAIQKISLQDKEGKVILPTKEDFASLRKNQVLEIVPGDRVGIAYEDPVVVTKGKELHEQFLTATFHNAKLSACFMEIKPGTQREIEYIPMRRFKAGDKINVFINDPDMDVSDKEDVIPFTARTPNGKPIAFKALETEKHSGIFIGTIFPVAGQPQRDVEMTVANGDDVIITYRDVENTDPGIPWDLNYTVEQTSDKVPELRVFDVTSLELTPAEREAWLKQKKQDVLGVEEQVPVTRTLVASLPEKPQGEAGAQVLATGPLIVELKYPSLAQSARSKATIFVQTAAARKKSGKDGAAGFDVSVPGTLKIDRYPAGLGQIEAPPGYRDVLVRGSRQSGDPLDDGRFLFHVPLLLGTIPEKSLIDEEKEKENNYHNQDKDQTPLTIWGSDEVFIGFKYLDNGAEKWVSQKVTLTSDVLFDVMDRRYQEERTGVYVGESVYFRVMHRSSDTSDDKDAVELALASSSGKTTKLKLSETMAHSGVFKGMVKLVYAGDKIENPDPDAFAVNYGDTLTATFASPKIKEPVKREIQVFKGADGKVTALTKRFKDPAIAVQTQLTLAEAYFEQAKRHRELGQKDLSVKEIATGKNILEEAQRDYPNTEARAQVDYLLANLSLEYASDAEDEAAVKKHHLEAISRFTDFVRSYPDSTYAPKAQYKKALTLEKMGQMDQACEEYVKLSYRYPDNELVAETIARLGQYFWNKGKTMLKESEAQQDAIEAEKIKIKARDMYKTAGQVFGRLSVRFPQHGLAGKTRVLSAQCFIQSGDIPKAIELFLAAIKDPNLDKDLIAESMYWCADCYCKQNEYPSAYRQFVKLTWDYPASKWAKFARGRLTEDQFAKMSMEPQEGN